MARASLDDPNYQSSLSVSFNSDPYEEQLPRKRSRKSSLASPKYCDICKITCNSERVYAEHVSGQKHIKKSAALGKTVGPVQSVFDNELDQSLSHSRVSLIKSNKQSKASSEDAAAVLQYINSLASYNNMKLEFTTSGETSSAHADGKEDENDSSYQAYEVKLKCGDQIFVATGSLIKEAQHIAALMALESEQLKRPPRGQIIMSNLPSDVLEHENQCAAQYTAYLFPTSGHPSALRAFQAQGRLRSNLFMKTASKDPQFNIFASSRIKGSVELRQALLSLKEKTENSLTAAAKEINATYRKSGDKRSSFDINSVPPAFMEATSLFDLDTEPYARMLYMIAVNPAASNVVSLRTRGIGIVLICDSILPKDCKPSDVDGKIKAFVSKIHSKVTNSKLVNDGKEIEVKNDGNPDFDYLTVKIRFAGLQGLSEENEGMVALRREHWFRSHLLKKPSSLLSLGILDDLRLNHPKSLGLLTEYDYQILVDMCSESDLACTFSSTVSFRQSKSVSQCPVLLTLSVLGNLAGGLLSSSGLGIADPCISSPSEWNWSLPTIAGTELDQNQRLVIMTKCQDILKSLPDNTDPSTFDRVHLAEHLITLKETSKAKK